MSWLDLFSIREEDREIAKQAKAMPQYKCIRCGAYQDIHYTWYGWSARCKACGGKLRYCSLAERFQDALASEER